MKFFKHMRTISLFSGLILGLISGQVSALTIAKVPLELTAQIKPNILIMLDNSGSMKEPMYSNSSFSSTQTPRSNVYNPSVTYLGIFDSTKKYRYDRSNLSFDTTAIGSGAGFAYPLNVVDTSEKNAFVEENCSYSSNPVAECWDGNFLNWLVTRRIDATRVVLVGGKVENRKGYEFGAYNSSTAKQFKIVGNNEPRDNGNNSTSRSFYAKYSGSSSVSPSNDNDLFQITSPVHSGSKRLPGTYKPYAKLINTVSGQSYNIALIVKTEPKGLLQDVASTMRLGLSFYYFNPNSSNIYSGSNADGGSLGFNIPLNPFVNNPNDSTLPSAQQGYRTLSGIMGTNINKLVDAIEHMPLVWGTTPLAENLWEVIQYFAQENPVYRSQDFTVGKSTNLDPYFVNGSLQSCIQSRVLVFTDGEPIKDANVPGGKNTRFGSGPWVGLLKPLGYDPDTNTQDSGSGHGRDNLDDVAYWAYCDRDKASCKSNSVGAVAANPNRDLRSDIPGDQYLLIDAIRFANGTVNSVMQDTADNAGGSAYAAPDGTTLKDALNSIFTNATTVSASSSVASNSTSLNTSSLIYQAQYNSKDWSGQLRALKLNQSTGAIASTQWDTNSVYPPTGTRKIFSYNPVTTSGIDFNYDDMSAAQQLSLKLASETDGTIAKLRVDYISGGTTNEIGGSSGTNYFRKRNKLLGDIVHSSPWFTGAENFGYSTLPGTEGSSYATFLSSKALRTKMLYVGANDGMLHGFNATTGKESFAYVPASVIGKLTKLTDPAYGKALGHDYFVDGAQRAGDVYVSNSWKTFLVGVTGAGARAVYALDVTDPDNFDENSVRWEFNETNDADMGFSLAEPTIARMANGKWVAIVPNGYNSTNNKAVLFILDIATGNLIRKISTKAGSSTSPNGLSTAIPVDTDGDHNVDAIYAGDLLGNMWKFDVSDSTDVTNWKVAYGSIAAPEPLFVARDSIGNRQPITAKPQVGLHPSGGAMVYFGTGRFFAVNDQIVGSNPQVQTYYAIRDIFTNGASTPVARSNLQQQSILFETSSGYRITSANAVNYATKSGWYMDLKPPASAPAQGERVVGVSLLRNDRIVFVTRIPNSNTCSTGGTSWLMEMDAVSGSRLILPAFDLGTDGKFDANDTLAVFDTNGDGTIDSKDKVPPSGKRLDGGATTPTVVQDGDKEYKYTSTSKVNATGNATLDVTTESVTNGAGRESWRQIKIN